MAKGDLKCGDCGYVGQAREFIGTGEDEGKHICPKDGSTFVDTPAEIERLKHGGMPGDEPRKRHKRVAA
jgi:hypothetical protein